MKNSRGKLHPKTYECRKCTRTDFKTPMEFTNHLRNCRVSDVPVTQLPMVGNGTKQDILRLRALGVEVQDLADRLLKKIK